MDLFTTENTISTNGQPFVPVEKKAWFYKQAVSVRVLVILLPILLVGGIVATVILETRKTTQKYKCINHACVPSQDGTSTSKQCCTISPTGKSYKTCNSGNCGDSTHKTDITDCSSCSSSSSSVPSVPTVPSVPVTPTKWICPTQWKDNCIHDKNNDPKAVDICTSCVPVPHPSQRGHDILTKFANSELLNFSPTVRTYNGNITIILGSNTVRTDSIMSYNYLRGKFDGSYDLTNYTSGNVPMLKGSFYDPHVGGSTNHMDYSKLSVTMLDRNMLVASPFNNFNSMMSGFTEASDGGFYQKPNSGAETLTDASVGNGISSVTRNTFSSTTIPQEGNPNANGVAVFYFIDGHVGRVYIRVCVPPEYIVNDVVTGKGGDPWGRAWVQPHINGIIDMTSVILGNTAACFMSNAADENGIISYEMVYQENIKHSYTLTLNNNIKKSVGKVTSSATDGKLMYVSGVKSTKNQYINIGSISTKTLNSSIRGHSNYDNIISHNMNHAVSFVRLTSDATGMIYIFKDSGSLMFSYFSADKTKIDRTMQLVAPAYKDAIYHEGDIELIDAKLNLFMIVASAKNTDGTPLGLAYFVIDKNKMHAA
jgi:hypothetical protein